MSSTPELRPYYEYLEQLARVSYICLHLEPTNACNAHCEMCPRDAMSRSLSMMQWSQFLKLMDVSLPSPLPLIAFVGFGEPTLHRRLSAMILHVRDTRPDIAIKVTSNGALLSRERIHELFASGLDLLELSVFGSSAASYEALMEGMNFSHTAQLIEELNSAGYKYTLTTVEDAESSRDLITQFWTALGAKEIIVKGAHRRGGYLQIGPKPRAASALGDYEERVDIQEGTSESCHKLHLLLHVNSRGKILPCPQEINENNVLGDINEHSELGSVLRVTRSKVPNFDICVNCELKQQNLLEYHAKFFSRFFADRLDLWRARLLTLGG